MLQFTGPERIMTKPTIYVHLRHDGETVKLHHHDRTMLLLDIFRGYPSCMPKVKPVPEITAALDRIIASVE